MNNIRIEEEMAVVEQMIRLYCRKHEGHAGLCPSCRELLVYAHNRLRRCGFGEDKPTCKKCPVHCYRPEMRERIRTVMRWSGPRMILYHPLAAVRHVLREIKAGTVNYSRSLINFIAPSLRSVGPKDKPPTEKPF